MTYGIALVLMIAIGVLLYFLNGIEKIEPDVKRIIKVVGIVIVILIACYIVFGLFNMVTGGALNKTIGG